MPTIEPLPIEIAVPPTPPHFPEESKPRWIQVEPYTYTHPPIPVEIEFPVLRPRRARLPLSIRIPGLGTFNVELQLNAVERAQSAG